MKREPMFNDKSALDMILNNLDKEVYIILTDNDEIKIEDGKVEVWASLANFENTGDKKTKADLWAILSVLRFCLDYNLGIKLNGIINEFEFIFDADEIKSSKKIIDVSTDMIKCLRNEITESEFLSKAGDIEIYFPGSFPKKGEILQIATLKSDESDKPLLPVFLTTYDIHKYVKKTIPINKAPLKDVVYFFNIFNIAIEPGKEYWVLIHK